jgi:small-conductance mechanosensitive channel
MFLLANTVFLILSVGYGWLAGDRLDRQAVAWIAAALLATLAATSVIAWITLVVLIIDMALLAAIVRIAVHSRRYWPTWFAGLHLAGVTFAFAAVLAAPDYVSTMRAFAGFWGTAALLVMVAGLFLDRRARAGTSAQSST